MLEGYEKLSNGVIKHVDATPLVYDEEYTIEYNARQMGALNDELSYLRLGLLLGGINQSMVKLLDVGYGDGNFLSKTKSIVKDCYGYDIPPVFPLPQGVERVDNVTGAYYDVVTFFNSLEHMPEIDFIKNIQCKYLMITTPWCHYFSDDWFETWKHRKPNEHIWHFNDETLTRFMNQSGYSVVHLSNVEDCLRGEKIGYASYLTAIFRKG